MLRRGESPPTDAPQGPCKKRGLSCLSHGPGHEARPASTFNRRALSDVCILDARDSPKRRQAHH